MSDLLRERFEAWWQKDGWKYGLAVEQARTIWQAALAAAAPLPAADCTCGFGGFHDDANKNCARYVPPAAPQPATRFVRCPHCKGELAPGDCGYCKAGWVMGRGSTAAQEEETI